MLHAELGVAPPLLRWVPGPFRYMFAALASARFYRRHAAAPWTRAGKIVERVRQRHAARAQALGYRKLCDPDLVLLADGQVIRPATTTARTVRFSVPAGAKRLRLLSRIAAPAETTPHARDRRRLGVAVAGLAFDGQGAQQVIGPREVSLCAGFYPVQGRRRTVWCWTDGAAELPHHPAAHPLTLTLTLGPAIEYWIAPASSLAERRSA
jgi:hypothetical protein